MNQITTVSIAARPKRDCRTRRNLLGLWISLSLVFLVGCGRVWGPEIFITWKSAKHGLSRSTPLEYKSIEIGKLTAINSVGDGTRVRARLYKKYSHYVTTKT